MQKRSPSRPLRAPGGGAATSAGASVGSASGSQLEQGSALAALALASVPAVAAGSLAAASVVARAAGVGARPQPLEQSIEPSRPHKTMEIRIGAERTLTARRSRLERSLPARADA